MSDDADDLLEKWLSAGQDLLTARRGSKKEEAIEERMSALEQRFNAKPEEERRDALDELDEEERELIRAHRAGERTQASGETEHEEGKEEKEEQGRRRTREGRRNGAVYTWDVDEDGQVRRLDIPTVYRGEDEPNRVGLPDAEEGEAA
jgi:hypothetical protein